MSTRRNVVDLPVSPANAIVSGGPASILQFRREGMIEALAVATVRELELKVEFHKARKERQGLLRRLILSGRPAIDEAAKPL
jgi:hypothetical protein